MCSLTELYEYLEAHIDDVDSERRRLLLDKTIALLKAGHECRNALVSLNPDSSWADELVEKYDEFWLAGDLDAGLPDTAPHRPLGR